MGGLTVKCGLVAILIAGLSACGGGTPDLLQLRSPRAGPDEFAIVPNEPLEIPQNHAALPVPTPGGANRSDPDPAADVAVALGGSAAAVRGGGIRGPELIARATRFGVEDDIRRVLAAEDLEFRRRNAGRVLERVLDVTTYYRVYDPQSLDQYAELERLRRAGIRTPAAPPEYY